MFSPVCICFRSQTPQESSPALSDFICFGNLDLLLKAHLLTSLFPYEEGTKGALRAAVNCSPPVFLCWVTWFGTQSMRELWILHSWMSKSDFLCSGSKTMGVSFPKCLLVTVIKGQWPLLIYPHIEDHSLHPQSPYWWYWVNIYLLL